MKTRIILFAFLYLIATNLNLFCQKIDFDESLDTINKHLSFYEIDSHLYSFITDTNISYIKMSIDQSYREEVVHFNYKQEGTIIIYKTRFYLPDSFNLPFNKNYGKNYIHIQQLHDNPPKGMSWEKYREWRWWETYKPSYCLTVHPLENKNDSFSIKGKYGTTFEPSTPEESLWIERPQIYFLDDTIIRNQWYTIECKIKLNLTDEGWLEFNISNEDSSYFYETKRIYRANKYNENHDYFKFGLYRPYSNLKSVIYYDYVDFSTQKTQTNIKTLNQENNKHKISFTRNTLISHSDKELRFSVFNLNGHILHHNQLISPFESVDLSVLPQGIYIFKIIDYKNNIDIIKKPIH